MNFRKQTIISFLLGIFIIYAHGNKHTNMSTDQDKQGGEQPKSHIPVVSEELGRVGIEEKIGEVVPDDLVFFNENGEKVFLKNLLKDKPTVLAFAYYSCPLICDYVLQGTKKALEGMSLKLGEDYNVVTISFDDRDNAEVTKNMKKKYSSDILGDGWNFLYGDKDNIKKITEKFGFKFKWVEANNEFAHSAAIYVVTPKRKISRYFYGLTYNPFELKLAVLEADKERSKSTIERVLLYCYRYDSGARGYVLHAQNTMKLGGGIMVVVMSGFLFIMFMRERKKDGSVVKKDSN